MGPEVSMCHSFYHSLGFLLGPLQLFAYLLLYTVDFKKKHILLFVYVSLCEREGGEVCVFVYVYVRIVCSCTCACYVSVRGLLSGTGFSFIVGFGDPAVIVKIIPKNGEMLFR